MLSTVRECPCPSPSSGNILAGRQLLSWLFGLVPAVVLSEFILLQEHMSDGL